MVYVHVHIYVYRKRERERERERERGREREKEGKNMCVLIFKKNIYIYKNMDIYLKTFKHMNAYVKNL